MPHRDTSLTKAYNAAHPGKDWDIYLWTNLANQTDHANRITFAYEDWLATDRSEPAPDLVEWFATYGYIRYRLQNWKLPITLSPEEMARWREGGYFVTIDDFYAALGTVAAGIIDMTSRNPALTTSIIQSQLEDKLSALERNAALPLEEYTPKYQEWQIREGFKARGLKDKNLNKAVEFELLDDNHLFEVQRWNEKLFEPRDELQSFEWGMETLRMLTISETSADLGLPNQELFGELLKIDLNRLIARLEAIDVKLRRIWRNLADYDCYCVNAEHEPEQFWWRHFPRGKSSKRPR